MASDIVVIVPDVELKWIIEKLQPTFETKFDIYQGFLDEAVSLVKELECEGTRIIVSRGGTADLIKKTFPHLPLVNIPITTYDAIHILYKAKQIPGKIGVVGFPTLVEVALEAAELLDIEVTTYTISSLADTAIKVKQAKKDGCTTIIGGKEAVRNATELHICGIQIFSHEKTVYQALSEAEKVLSAMKNELRNSQKLSFILNSISHGIAYVDSRGNILHLNRNARNIIGVSNMDIKEGMPFDDYCDIGIRDAVENKKNWIGEVKSIGQGKYAVNLEIIIIEDEIIGAVITFQGVKGLQNLEQKVRRDLYQKGLIATHDFSDIIHSDKSIKKTIETAKQYAKSNSTVFIWGESGTGKEVFAQSIHNQSSRKDGPFVAINCAALPENLIESELFGYVEGAFTGARKGGKSGLFELAHQGTLFLDEIGDVPMSVQARLLRALEEKKIRRIGDDRVIPVDVRIISATNKDLKNMIGAGKFREDLYYRINVLRLELPPLRERKNDIPQLVELFAKEINKINSMEVAFTDKAFEEMKQYSYPGNVRELRNITERLIVSSPDGQVTDETVRGLSEFWFDVGENASSNGNLSGWYNGKKLLEKEEMKQIYKVLDETCGNRAKAAEVLGISKTTLWRKLKESNINE